MTKYLHSVILQGSTLPAQYPGNPGSPRSPRSPQSPSSPSRTLPRNFKSYHEASGVHALLEQPYRNSIGGSQTLPKNYKATSPVTSPLGSPTKSRDAVIDLPVGETEAWLKGFRVKCKFREEILKIYILGSFHIESLQEVFTKKIGSYRVDILRGANSTCLIFLWFARHLLLSLSPSLVPRVSQAGKN